MNCHLSLRCKGRVELALKACFEAFYSAFNIHATALKCRSICASYRHNALANALPFEEMLSVTSTPAYTTGHNTKMSSSFYKLLFEYDLIQEAMNVAYSVWMIFFFFKAMKLAYFISEAHWGLTNAAEMCRGNSHAVQSASMGNLVTL